MENHYIQVCDVEKYYGQGTAAAKAVDRVSFHVDRGEFVRSEERRVGKEWL